MLIKLLITFLMILMLSCSSNSNKIDTQSTPTKNEKTENNKSSNLAEKKGTLDSFKKSDKKETLLTSDDDIISIDKVEELLQDKNIAIIDNRPIRGSR